MNLQTSHRISMFHFTAIRLVIKVQQTKAIFQHFADLRCTSAPTPSGSSTISKHPNALLPSPEHNFQGGIEVEDLKSMNPSTLV